MAYTETSTYEYITGDELEAYTARDYGTIDARYTEAVVMAKVSHAERIIRGLTKETTSTDGTKSLVLELAAYLWEKQIHADHPENATDPDDTIFRSLLTLLMPKEEYSPVDSIPMQGIDR